jgi:hypothetical protein
MATDFETIHSTLKAGEAGKLERNRRRYVAKVYSCVIVFVACIVYAFSVYGAVALWIGVPVLVVTAIAVDFFSHSFYARLTTVYKTVVAPEIVRLVDERLSYDRYQGLQSYYIASDLYPQQIDSYICEDTLSGKLGKTWCAFGEMRTSFTTSYAINGSKQVRTVFQGIFFVAEFNRHLSHETILLPDTLEFSLGSLGRGLQKLNGNQDGKLIRLENPQFEPYFVVYSTDEQESRYILTPDMMEKILLLNRKLGGNIRIAFKGSYMYIACVSKTNWFKADAFRSLLNRKEIEKQIRYVRIMSGIVEDLNLNTRIWTKE